MGSQNVEETVVHPLFTVDEDLDDDEIKTVTSLHVVRKENGKLVYAPRQRSASELTSLEQIQAEFGGGDYVLIGYNNGRISARKNITLPGKPKPMHDDGIDEPVKIPNAGPVQAVPNPMVVMGGEQGIFGLIMMMMQQMMQQQAQAAQNQMQMFMTIMQTNQQATSDEKAQARAELQANIERERQSSERTMALMREMMTSRGGGSGEEFSRGVEFMRHFTNQQLEVMKMQAKSGGDIDLNSILETFGQAVQAFNLFKGNHPEGLPANPLPVEATPVG